MLCGAVGFLWKAGSSLPPVDLPLGLGRPVLWWRELLPDNLRLGFSEAGGGVCGWGRGGDRAKDCPREVPA